MYLERMEVQGFKTFAKKTVLHFPAPTHDDNALTVVVGPNGSGKSNLADAIRWCLGEQSMKLLRGKKTEDIIFSGSEGKSRSGFAEVSLCFNNADKSLSVDFAEVTITRRLYRDGESAYLLNGQEVRLGDVQLLLAEAGVGQRSYSVIGQGMIDHVLTATPEERKIFFDDATGVRGFQIKRHQALLKLQRSVENLSEVELLLRELEPRLNLLRRQVKRLSEREKVEGELQEVTHSYYFTMLGNLLGEKVAATKRAEEAQTKVQAKRAELDAGDAKLLAMEKVQTSAVPAAGGEGMQALQAAYKAAQNELALARRVQVAAERDLELAKVRAQSSWAPLPLPSIIDEVGGISAAQEGLFQALRAARSLEQVQTILLGAEAVLARSKKLRERLTRPSTEDFTPAPVLLEAIRISAESIAKAEATVQTTEKAMDAKAKESTTVKTEVFTFQRELRQLQQELSALEAQANSVAIDIARIETREEGLKAEMRDVAVDETLIRSSTEEARLTDLAAAHDKMHRLRHQLELIGGIDQEIVKEHADTDERFTFLSTQLADLRQAIRGAEKVIDELDEQIKGQSEKVFKAIDMEFQKYFKVLFGGGSCSLVKMTRDDVDEETRVDLDRAIDEVAEKEIEEHEESLESLKNMVKVRKDAVLGIDIQATPPGKKLKALNLLSGGERALTAIALVSAIMATNPSPFVVLDEVDAALDEANTVRFANILHELRKHTQFVVITHNRATMEKADVLYGVTMGEDGVSDLLSVKLEELTDSGSTARR